MSHRRLLSPDLAEAMRGASAATSASPTRTTSPAAHTPSIARANAIEIDASHSPCPTQAPTVTLTRTRSATPECSPGCTTSWPGSRPCPSSSRVPWSTARPLASARRELACQPCPGKRRRIQPQGSRGRQPASATGSCRIRREPAERPGPGLGRFQADTVNAHECTDRPERVFHAGAGVRAATTHGLRRGVPCMQRVISMIHARALASHTAIATSMCQRVHHPGRRVEGRADGACASSILAEHHAAPAPSAPTGGNAAARRRTSIERCSSTKQRHIMPLLGV